VKLHPIAPSSPSNAVTSEFFSFAQCREKDGELVWYTMESTHMVEALRKKFEEQVPSIRLNTFRSRRSEIANRISVEAKTEHMNSMNKRQYDRRTCSKIAWVDQTASALPCGRRADEKLPRKCSWNGCFHEKPLSSLPR
jgi:hypothetical protein